MQLLSKPALHALSQRIGDRAISMYLPTHVKGAEIQQDPIRLKNLLSEAEAQLQQLDVSANEIQQLLEPVTALLDDERFWRHQSHGLAIFRTSDSFKLYRLPRSFEPLVVISDRFHLKPLLPLFFEDRVFYILAFSQNKVRFFQSTRYQIGEVHIEAVPNSLSEALQYDVPEKQLQFHSTASSGSQPTYHGHGTDHGDNRDSIQRFLTQVDRGLQPYLNRVQSYRQAPLILAAVDELQSIYREVNTYADLLDEGISGNPDLAQPDDLREAAWSQVQTLLDQSYHQAEEQYHSLKGTGKADDHIEQLAIAAHRGQIDTVWVAPHAHYWGKFDPQSGRVEHHDEAKPNDLDLLDFIAVHTFLNGGTVYMPPAGEDMPTDAPAAAVYRYGVPAEV